MKMIRLDSLALAATVLGQSMTMVNGIDPACPDGTLSSGTLNFPNGTACVLCSTIVGTCSASCSGPSNAMQCGTSPEGCGTIVCPEDPPAPTPTPPAPTPRPPTAAPAEPPEDVGTPEECGIELEVGCVLHDTAGSPNPVACSDYVPASAAECSVMARFYYNFTVSAPPLNSVFLGATRYVSDASSQRATVYGNPLQYYEGRVGSNVTPHPMSKWSAWPWEAETINFCASSSSVTTTFQIVTDGGDSGLAECRISGVDDLVIPDAAFAPIPVVMSAEDEVAPPAPPSDDNANQAFTVAVSVAASDDASGPPAPGPTSGAGTAAASGITMFGAFSLIGAVALM